MKRLQPLTVPEVERMRDAYASGPLTTTPRHETTDAALANKGWVEQYDDEVGTITPSKAAYRADNGRCVLYDEHGGVADCWRIK